MSHFRIMMAGLAAIFISQTTLANQQMADKYHKHNGKRIAKSVQKKINLPKQLDRIMASVRKNMLDAMKRKDPRSYKNMMDEIDKIKKLDPAQKAKAAQRILSKYKALINFGKQAVAREAKSAKMQAKRLALRYRANLVFGDFLDFIIEWLDQVNQQPTGQVIQELDLNGNYDFEIEKTTGVWFTSSLEAEANLVSGQSRAEGYSIVAGSFTAEAGVAKLIDVPAGVDKVHVQFTTQTNSDMIAFADFAMSFGGTDVVLEVLNGTFEQLHCSRSKNLISVVAPLLYLVQVDNQEPESITCEIDTNGQPQSLLVSATVITYGTQALLGIVGGYSTHHPSEFRVQLITEN